MKKCPACGSVAMDQDSTCGVCGNDLSSAVAMNESSLDLPVSHAPGPEPRRLNKTALMAALAGPLITLLGLVLFLNLLNLGSELIALSGLVILMAGLITTIGVIGAGPSFRGWLRYRTRGRRFPDKYGSYDPRPPDIASSKYTPAWNATSLASSREVEAEESQTSAEEQEEEYQDREERKKEKFD